MPMFRCLECAGEFEAAKPCCAACGIDGAKGTPDEGVVVELVLHHFDPPSRRAGRGLGHAACDPKIKVGVPRCAFTGEPGSVNCPKCKAGEVYKAANGASNGAVEMRASALGSGG